MRTYIRIKKFTKYNVKVNINSKKTCSKTFLVTKAFLSVHLLRNILMKIQFKNIAQNGEKSHNLMK